MNNEIQLNGEIHQVGQRNFIGIELNKEMHSYNPYGDAEYDFGPREGATSVARPPPDYRTTAEPPRPQTYDSYEQTRPTPNGRENNPVRRSFFNFHIWYHNYNNFFCKNYVYPFKGISSL